MISDEERDQRNTPEPDSSQIWGGYLDFPGGPAEVMEYYERKEALTDAAEADLIAEAAEAASGFPKRPAVLPASDLRLVANAAALGTMKAYVSSEDPLRGAVMEIVRCGLWDIAENNFAAVWAICHACKETALQIAAHQEMWGLTAGEYKRHTIFAAIHSPTYDPDYWLKMSEERFTDMESFCGGMNVSYEELYSFVLTRADIQENWSEKFKRKLRDGKADIWVKRRDWLGEFAKFRKELQKLDFLRLGIDPSEIEQIREEKRKSDES